MTEALLDSFLSGETDNRAFGHADHLRVAFELLQRQPFPQAAATFSSALKVITAKAGNPGAYHETITLAFLALIAERRVVGELNTYEDFARANSDLLDKSVLTRWYTPERLNSGAARKTFILPEPGR
jgi:hypothetical protein